MQEIEERREELLALAREVQEDEEGPYYDDDATGLIAVALETRDSALLDRLEEVTHDWLESRECKNTRQYLIDTAREAIELLGER